MILPHYRFFHLYRIIPRRDPRIPNVIGPQGQAIITSFRSFGSIQVKYISNFPPPSVGQDVVSTTNKYCCHLHIAPDGDWWTSDDAEIFAAKHLQPDYVHSLPIDNEEIIFFLETYQNQEKLTIWMQNAYDTKSLPLDLQTEFHTFQQTEKSTK